MFSLYQQATAAPGWTKDRLFQALKDSALEIFCLAPVLRIYELLFTASGTETRGTPSLLFSPIHSPLLSAHMPQLIPAYAAIPPTQQLSHYQTYRSPGAHAHQGQALFSGADFYTRHGVMHACFVAQFVPVFLALYKNAGHPEAAALAQEDVLGLQIVAFFHDYGRIVKGVDLGSDHGELERISGEAAYQYLRQAMGYTDEKARRLSNYTVDKDGPIATKPLLQQVLQSCDSLAVLRADDWVFNKSYLDLTRWIDANIPAGPRQSQAKEELNAVIDAAKQMLVGMGDSPFSMACHSLARQGQVIQGNFSLATKRTYEKSPNCYAMMEEQMQRHPALRTR